MKACSLPFNGFMINGIGKFSPCCYLSTVAGENNICLDLDSDVSCFDDDQVRDLRKQHITVHNTGSIDGINSDCIRCMTDIGSYNEYIPLNDIPDCLNVNTGEMVIDKNYSSERAIIALGNKCNLACRMCAYTNSSTFAYKMHHLIDITEVFEFDDPVLQILNQTYPKQKYHKPIEKFKISELNVILPYTQNTKHLVVHGGEPFMYDNDLLFEYLTKINPQELTIHTNGMVKIDDRFIELFETMNSVNLVYSIDGGTEVNDYIRLGADLKIIHNNMEIISNKSKRLQLSINTVYNMYNYNNIDDILKNMEYYNSIRVTNWYLQPNLAGMALCVDKSLTLDEFAESKHHLLSCIVMLHTLKLGDTLKSSVLNTLISNFNNTYNSTDIEQAKYRSQFENFTKLVDDTIWKNPKNDQYV